MKEYACLHRDATRLSKLYKIEKKFATTTMILHLP